LPQLVLGTGVAHLKASSSRRQSIFGEQVELDRIGFLDRYQCFSIFIANIRCRYFCITQAVSILPNEPK